MKNKKIVQKNSMDYVKILENALDKLLASDIPEAELKKILAPLITFSENFTEEKIKALKIISVARKSPTIKDFGEYFKTINFNSTTLLLIISQIDELAKEEINQKIKFETDKKIKEKQKEVARLGGKAKGEKNKDKKQEIIQIWLSGKYDTRDICAEEEYATLKFKSFRMARNALINTPNPESKNKK